MLWEQGVASSNLAVPIAIFGLVGPKVEMETRGGTRRRTGDLLALSPRNLPSNLPAPGADRASDHAHGAGGKSNRPPAEGVDGRLEAFAHVESSADRRREFCALRQAGISTTGGTSKDDPERARNALLRCWL